MQRTRHTLFGQQVTYDLAVPEGEIRLHPETFMNMLSISPTLSISTVENPTPIHEVKYEHTA